MNGRTPKKRVIRLRYDNPKDKIRPRSGLFMWDPREDAFTECAYEGVGLYADDGWRLLGWAEEKV